MGFDRYFITRCAIDGVNLNFEREENRWPFEGTGRTTPFVDGGKVAWSLYGTLQ